MSHVQCSFCGHVDDHAPGCRSVRQMTPQYFAEFMEHELQANQHKGDWHTWVPGLDQAFRELDHHVQKLKTAMQCGMNDKVREHAADTANILMKIMETYG